MNILKLTIAGAGFLGLAAICSVTTASAAPLGVSGAAVTRSDAAVTQVQYRRGNRVVRGNVARGRVVRGGRYGYRGGYRGRGNAGGAVAAGLALGVLGAIAASEAARAQPACWTERRRMYNGYGNYVGTRRVRVCR